MNTDNLTTWRLKIARAQEHFEALESEITAWLGTSPMAIVKEKDAEGYRHTVFVKTVNAPPLNRWSLIAGDCVHNLRSALDSLLYGIAIHETGLNLLRTRKRFSSSSNNRHRKKGNLCFTMEPPNPDLAYEFPAVIVVCVAHPPGPSKSPFSGLAGVLQMLIEEVGGIVIRLETIVREMRSVSSVTLKQTAYFTIGKDEQVTSGRLQPGQRNAQSPARMAAFIQSSVLRLFS